MKTVRRNGRQDFPKISIYSLTEEQAREYVQLLKEEVWVQVRGMVSTKMVDKHIKCEACGHVSPINLIVSPSFVLNFKDSFQSTWACMPGLVSNRITASLCFSMFKL